MVSAPKAEIWQGTLSPNRRWASFIVVRAERPNISEVTVASFDGSSPRQLVRIAADHTWADKPRWAPDGRALYFISRRPGSFFNLWAVRFDADRGTPVGEPRALSAFDSPALYISPDLQTAQMDVSPRHAVLSMRSVSGSIWMLDGLDR